MPLLTEEESFSLAQEIYARQGYLVMGATSPLAIGAQVPSFVLLRDWEKRARWRVIGTATEQEWRNQLPDTDPGIPSFPWRFFYRIEAMD